MTEIARTARSAGVVGAGGAGFPTYVKLGSRAEVVIVNGAECEPLLRVDQQLMSRFPDEVIAGLEAAMRATGSGRGIVALKSKYQTAFEALSRRLGGREDISLVQLGDFYPAGDEHVLVYEVLGRAVPEGGIPLAVGAVVINVETALNLARALGGSPVVDKYVTVTGAVRNPQTFLVPVGTPFSWLIEMAGGPLTADFWIIDGGPMMGKVAGPGEVVTKTTKGLIVLPGDHDLVTRKRMKVGAMVRRAAVACCQCQLCTDLCPRHLLGHRLQPHTAVRALGYGGVADSSEVTQAFLCSGCGVCEFYACPHDISPRLMFDQVKELLAREGVANPHRRASVIAHPWREVRRLPTKRLVWRLGLSEYEHPAPLAEAEPPPRVVLKLKQSAGRPARPLVGEGQRVSRGQLIADLPEAELGVPLHASISGVVRRVDTAVVIERDSS
jgi:Na+-translocating ferredoxin:NAD+ oxidoreductase RnfC subunit